LYRIEGWNGFAMDTISASDTLRNMALEVSERIWYVKLPAALTPVKGDILYWTSAAFTAGYADSSLDLTATVTAGAGAAKVEEIKDANGYAGVRALNGGV
jgi:hypothetical protein